MRKGEDREIILNLAEAEHVPGFLILSYSLVSHSLSLYFLELGLYCLLY
jgi:hypothetical protein